MSDLNVISQEDREAVADLGYKIPAHVTVLKGKNYLTNAKGNLDAVENIKPQHLLEDEAVRKIMVFAEELQAQIQRFRHHTLADISDFLAVLMQEYGVTRGGTKGNVTLTTYDGLRKVQLAVADVVAFGPELQAAKALIDECLAEWSSDSVAPLRTIVQGAFDVEKEGEVSPSKLFPLLRYDIDDARWKRAMTAIVDAIQIRGTKEYVRFYRRASAKSAWERVSIDAASA